MFFWIIECIQMLYQKDTRNAVRAFRLFDDASRQAVIYDMIRYLPECGDNEIISHPEHYFVDLMQRNPIFRSIFYSRSCPQWNNNPRLRDCIRRSMLHMPGDQLIYISAKEIGKGLLIYHGPVAIGENVRIGDNVTISGYVIIGKRHRESPVIGNNVHINAQATILGPVSVGDNAVIGAGTLVLKDVQANTVVAGNPAKVLHEVTGNEHKRVKKDTDDTSP